MRMGNSTRKWIFNGYGIICFILVIFLVKIERNGVGASLEGDAVGQWAERFGEELWELGQKMTKSSEIKARYKQFNSRVEKKDGESLIKTIAENVGLMFTTKIEAVNAILSVAEDMSESFEYNESRSDNYTYYSSKWSLLNNVNRTDELPEPIANIESMYKTMYVDYDTHFFNISVNISHSAVQVPSNVYDRYPEVMETMQWSESLDQVFVENYRSDPALSWQYFCSETGILRHYPAMGWENRGVDTYDCRKRSWYIEAATCSKDVVILLDNSGSMTGFRNYIAQLTVKSILDTFSNNDFLNIYTYSNEVVELVDCFKDLLIQATPENAKVFNDAVKELKPEGYANVSKAFVKGFELLEEYRERRRCNESSTGCNQAIMLITDGVAGNITEVFEKYNWLETGDNSSKTVPVRVFTYLLGKEVTKVREIQWMACLNRGYYSHIKNLEEVSEDVLKYVNVIATPLVLQGVEHPPTWTHAFTDRASSYNDKDPPRLMIAVGVPCFDKKVNKQNGTKTANLLGVAGTDVPVEEIDKLTLPYMLGVNGYSFIVSNNGYVLLHPDLRPVYKGNLKENYNSIDFSEIEQFDDNRPVRDPGDDLINLRRALVYGETGKKEKVLVRFHYDNMRRVSSEYQDFYHTQLPHTPFSLGIVIPHVYGNTWIKVGDEVKRNQHSKINISDYFVGENWKVHPEWVYCKFHYLEGHEFDSPEKELSHFLIKILRPSWHWQVQYGEKSIDDCEDVTCERAKLKEDSYYCNKELVQLLIFDAKVTNSSFRSWEFENKEEQELIESYNATLRFVASMSGLTRWQFIYGEVEVATDREFGDYHTKAVDEQWYKSAILQHGIDPHSFIFSVPHDEDDREEGELKVTASHAIFPRDGGLEAPGCVVGFQFSHEMMYDRFMEITSTDNCKGCIDTCSSDELDCYVIDHNGYVVLSEEQNNTGMFFGELDDGAAGAIMEAMVELNIFREIVVFDLQALCFKEVQVASEGVMDLMNPMKYILLGVKWIITEIIIYLSRINIWIDAVPFEGMNEYEDDYDEVTMQSTKLRKGQNSEEEEYFSRPKENKTEMVPYACDKQSKLYLLNQTLFIQSGFSAEQRINCTRPFFVKRIPNTNLLLITIRTIFSSCSKKMTAEPQDILYQTEFPCHKLNLTNMARRRLDECFTDHPDESEFHECGTGSFVQLKVSAAIICSFILLFWKIYVF